ncbi:GreA/GreB family elongation factor [Kamptonema cortianum]|nr:GreA/GreB family elongation factor [Oscillatoria laete-virens]MDK3159909.1 GreA/GreB family elongation factor [Kamptonema cortianum]MDL5050523.1 GreA/GreB family elongation factor [Oscillatoria amoena NRMC-F 0135]MDL5055535.1 GreA/GreB family elongation factor [Oscillatoria laete-virens NRMC-F 0139]
MSEQFQKLLDAKKITPGQFAKLQSLQPGAYVTHKSWGFGQIKDYDFVTGQILIDFKGKPSHPMLIPYAADSLVSLPAGHVLALQASDPAGLKKMAAEDSVGFLKAILGSFPSGTATPAQIEPLFKEFYTPAEWKKVWSKVRADLKKNPLYTIPTGKNDPIIVRDQPADTKTELLETFNQAVGLKPQTTAALDILREIDLYKDSKESMLVVVNTLNLAIEKNVSGNLLSCVELSIIRDEIKEAVGIGQDERLTTDFLLLKAPDLGRLISALPAARAKRVLHSIKVAHPEDWDTRLLKIFNSLEGGLISETYALFKEDKRTDVVVRHIDKLIREHSINTPIILWLAKDRPDDLYDLFNVRFAQAAISTLEREQFARDGRTGGKLHDLLLENKTFLRDLLEDADLEEVKDFVRNLQISPAFEELNKRSMLGRVVKMFPEVQALISHASATAEAAQEKPSTLFVSWKSLERRKEELDRIINVEIPANIKEIEVAKSYGDLRENHEFKAAKERQRILARRRGELELMLELAQGIDFANVDTTQVSIGTEVTLEDTGTGETLVYNVLGAWDSDPDKGVISYQTTVGQALVYKKPGETADLPSDKGTRKVQIKSIRAFTGEV